MTISFSGLASGLDTSSWIDALTSLKRAKVTTMEQKQTSISLQKDALAGIKSYFTSFRTSIEKLTDANIGVPSMDIFIQNVATSSDASKITATADSTAKESSYSIKVNQLAGKTEARSIYSNRVYTSTKATGDTQLNSILDENGNSIVKSGTIEVMVNGVNRSVDINENETLDSFVNKLNNLGVSAYFDDTTWTRLESSSKYLTSQGG